MYCIIDLRQEPPVKVQGTDFETEQECINWITQNGDVTMYTIAISE